MVSRSQRVYMLTLTLLFCLIAVGSIYMFMFLSQCPMESTGQVSVVKPAAVMEADSPSFELLPSFHSKFSSAQRDRKLLVVVVVGTRPEIIKMAPLVRVLKDNKAFSTAVELFICFTGQHLSMATPLLSLFEMHEDIVLKGTFSNDQPLAFLDARIEMAFHRFLKDISPHLVFVQGDTTSALAAGRSSFYNHVPIAHVESGLRTYDLRAPFPEEFNRLILDRITALSFTPTLVSKHRLLREGVPDNRVFFVGNTVIDSLFWVLERLKGEKMQSQMRSEFESMKVPWQLLDQGASRNGRRLPKNPLILLTAHRRENHGAPLREVFGSVLELLRTNDQISVVYPVHPNPNVKNLADEMLGNTERVFLLPPLRYDQLVFLMDRAWFIVTDSGGIQEEATGLGKPTLVLRESSERMEGVYAGVTKVIGTDRKEFLTHTRDLLTEGSRLYDFMSQKKFPFGDGTASEQIWDVVLQHKSVLSERRIHPLLNDPLSSNEVEEILRTYA